MRRATSLAALALIVAVACSVTGYATAPRDPVEVGMLADFPAGSVTPIDLNSSFYNPDQKGEVSHIPLILVHDEDSDEIIAYYAREPRSGCPVVPDRADVRLNGYCVGTQYTLAGECFGGPCLRDLDRFGVLISDAGEVSIDVQDFQKGDEIPIEER